MDENKKHILVVEDNEMAGKIAEVLFKQVGCEIDHAKDGREAVEMVTKNHYDGICMDIGLPIMSGVEACKAIRQYEAAHHLAPIPIVAVTGNNNFEEASEYVRAGMQASITKPLTKEKAEQVLSFFK